MFEFNDQDFLRVNALLDFVSSGDLEAVQQKQFKQFELEGACPVLVELLTEDYRLDFEKMARLVACQDALKGGGDAPERFPATPRVAITSKDYVSPPERTVELNPDQEAGLHPITPTTSRRRPPEVEKADQDASNRVGHFAILCEVGRGGIGRVYRAWENSVGRIVALKVIETGNDESRDRFLREAEIPGRFHHPVIATVYPAGIVRGKSYIAMQFIDGEPVGTASLPAAKAIELIRDAARALSYAHEMGILHREIKPGYLMVDRDGKRLLTDFGHAPQVVGDVGAQISVAGEVMETPQFMSPEQAAGEGKAVDARTGVYSLGATLYTLLADRPPFTARAIGPLLIDVIEQVPHTLTISYSRYRPKMVTVPRENAAWPLVVNLVASLPGDPK